MIHLLTNLTLISSCVSLAYAQATDITVQDKTLIQRCLIDDAPSTRMIAVGNPGGFNYAFDALHCAPVFAWSGGFLDFKGEVNGRGGNPCKVLGVRQSLGTDTIPFRVKKSDVAPEAIKFHGYRRDAETGEPTFTYAIDGFPVEQKVDFTTANVVTLNFTFPKPSESKNYYRVDVAQVDKVELSEGLTLSGKQVIEFPAGATTAKITLHLKPANKKFVRKIVKLSGEQIYKMHCNACHSLDGSKLIGPSFKGFFGKKHNVVRNGQEQQVLVDAAYLKESITDPQAAIVKGYEAVPMPSFSKVLSKREIETLVKYLSKL
ncbi:cytochrome c [Verrucomicrobiaceae bacterium R5-34]|nr:cytochrome c [Verrucomicrobiaceae bacterium R5-34]